MDLSKLNLPPYPFKLKKKNGKIWIPCLIRNKDIVLTPEEWVRQNFLQFLIQEKNYPKNLIAVEKQITVNKMTKRFDLMVFDQSIKPILLGEFKSPSINISENTFKQVINYNKAIGVSHLILSNGIDHYYTNVNSKIAFIDITRNIPNYENLSK